MQPDVLIAGGGLAGACAAFCLSRSGRRVRLLEAEAPAAGASGAAAGSVNPFMGRRARPTWRLPDALGALRRIVGEAGTAEHFRQTGVLRPARSAEQAGFFRETADEHPERTRWLRAEVAGERFPAARAPHGALWIEGGGAADVPALIDALLSAAKANGATVESGARVDGWKESASAVRVRIEQGEAETTREAGRLLLCVGQGFGHFPALDALRLRAVKGQTIRLERPPALRCAALPVLSCSGYVVPVPGGGALIAGSTYEHDFDDLAPTAEGTRSILENVRKMLPALEGAEVLSARAGARVSPGASPLPALGPLPGGPPPRERRVWVFAGLGSRGLLTAPLLARELPMFLSDPSRIPETVRARAA